MAHRTESEVLIIGSGFGGSIAAKRLTDAGLDVVLLERGPWRDTTPTRSMGIRARSPLPQGWRLLTHGFRSIRMPGFRKAGLTLNTRGFFEAFFANGIWLFCTSNAGRAFLWRLTLRPARLWSQNTPLRCASTT